MHYSYEGFNQINLEYLNYTIMHSTMLEVSHSSHSQETCEEHNFIIS